jgi:hypothetical protein
VANPIPFTVTARENGRYWLLSAAWQVIAARALAEEKSAFAVVQTSALA